jgi:MFS family permease
MDKVPRDALLLVAAAVALLAITMGSRSVLGLFVSPLNSATGLGIASISFAFALSQLTWGAAQPFCGLLAERFGPARIILAGTLLGAACGALLPLASSATLLATVLGLSGVAAAVGSPPLLIGAVSPRFSPARRALVAGVIGCGMPLGQLLLAPATQATIALAGWVSAALALAALSLASAPLALAFRQRASTPAHPAAGAPLRVASRARATGS